MAASAQYRITEQDYVSALRLHARPSWVALAAIALLLTGLACAAVFGPPELRTVFVCGLIGGAVLPLVIKAILPWQARRQYRVYKALHGLNTVELRNDGLLFASAHGEGMLLWEHVTKWREGDRHLLLYVMPRLFHVLPRAVAAQGFDMDSLMTTLQERAGKPV